ncbi:MAG: hypothetical protein CME24_08135 [Gemmatimonadetes bacterium]|nr:hypothetical protein [Gemmatimonadota bacterium]
MRTSGQRGSRLRSAACHDDSQSPGRVPTGVRIVPAGGSCEFATRPTSAGPYKDAISVPVRFNGRIKLGRVQLVEPIIRAALRLKADQIRNPSFLKWLRFVMEHSALTLVGLPRLFETLGLQGKDSQGCSLWDHNLLRAFAMAYLGTQVFQKYV